MRNMLLIILLCSFINETRAKEKVLINAEPVWLRKINPDLNKIPALNTVSNGYYLELIDNQVNLVNQTEYTHFIRHIINESGVQNASEVSVVFSPEFQQVIFHRIAIIRNGTTINQLTASQVKVVQEETDASDFQYNGLKRAFVTLKDVQKNDRIEVSYSVTGFNPVFNGRYSRTFDFYSQTAISNYFITVITDPKKKFFIKAFNNAPEPVEKLEGNFQLYQWNNPKLADWKPAPEAPSWFTDYPYVSMTEYNNWEEVVKWGLDIFKNYNYPLPESLKSKIAGWRKTAKSDNDLFTNLALRFVQDQIRYLGLEIGEYTHQPHGPADVYTRRFGDCKDKALLLAAILRQENIHAYVALVNTDSREKLTTLAPSATAFDHAIVALERSSGYIYIDPTITSQRGELVNSYIPAYGYALVLREGENKLEPVDPGFLHNTSIVEKLDVEFKENSNFSVTTIYSGGAADNARSSFASASDKEIEDNSREYYNKMFEGIQSAGAIKVTDDSLKNEITVHEFYSIPHLWRENGKDKELLDVYAKSIYEQVPDPSASSGKTPLALSFPRTMHYVMEINMPEQWQFNIEGLHIKNTSYQFDFSPTVNGSHINLKYYFKTLKDNIPAEDVLQFKTDYKQIVEKLEFELYKSKDQSNVQTSKNRSALAKSASWPVIWFTFIFMILYTALLAALNKRKAGGSYTFESGRPLGGWVIVLGITVGLALIIELIGLVNNNYFSHAAWIKLDELGGGKLQSLLLAELGFLLFRIGGCVALIYWFIGRRDIFPRMFIWYVGAMLAGQVLLFILYSSIPYPSSFGNLQTQTGAQFVRTCFYGAIWVTYVLRSERVKSTFLQPFKV